MPSTPEVFLSQRSITTFNSGVQDDLQITELANGRILMSWRSENDTGAGSPSGSDIIGQMFDALGNRIGDEFRLNTFYTTDDQSHHSVAALDTGGWVVTYQDAGTADSIRVETYNDLGVRTDARSIQNDNNASFPNYANPVVAHSGGSSVLVAYEGIFTAASSNVIYYRAYNPVTETIGAQQVLFTTGSGAFGLDFSSVEMTVLENGNYVAVAQFHNSSIQMRIITPTGTSVLSQTSVAGTATNGSELDLNPQVAALTGGGYVVTWQNEGSDTDVFYQVYSATGSAMGSTRIADTGGTNETTQPQIAGLEDGGFVLFWNDLEDDALRLQRYDATGLPVGDRITVVTDADVASVETVEALSDGRFVVGYTGILGEPRFKIYDPRDEASYNSDRNIIGTAGNDLINVDQSTFLSGAPSFFDGVEVFAFDGNDTIDLTDRDYIALTHIDGGRGTDTVVLQDIPVIDYTNNPGSDVDLETGLIAGAGNPNVSIGPVTLESIENLTGSLGNDTIRGDALANTLRGESGHDYIFGRAGDDYVHGGGGNDTLVASQGVDTLIGSSGNDTFLLQDLGVGEVGAGTVFTGNSGTDNLRIEGTDLNSFIVDLSAYAFSGIETLDFRGVHIDASVAEIQAFSSVIGQGGAAGRIIVSMDGFVNADFSSSVFGGFHDLTVVGNGADNLINAFSASSGLGAIQFLYGGGGRDTITGSDGLDSIGAGSGNDVVYGLDNNDTINGASGHDLLDGGDGNDKIYSGNGNDTLLGGDGFDELFITSGSATVDGGFGNDTIYFAVGVNELQNNDRFYSITGGTDYNGGFDLLDFSMFGAAVAVGMNGSVGWAASDLSQNASNNVVDFLFEFDAMRGITGSDYNDNLSGFDYNGTDIRTIEGGLGNDTITGGYDTRNMYGEAGDDVIDGSGLIYSDLVGLGGLLDVSGGRGDDHITGSAYFDTLIGGTPFSGGSLEDLQNPQSDDDTIYGGGGGDRIFGDHQNASTLTIYPNASADGAFDRSDDPYYVHPLGGGDDVIFGGDGQDTIFGDIGDDYIVGGDEEWSGEELDQDVLIGGLGNDTLLGGAMYDQLLGGRGDDSLDGGSGDDALIGGDGADTMDGGEGEDTLSYYDYLEKDTDGVRLDLEAGTGSKGFAAGDVFTSIEVFIGSRFDDRIVDGSAAYSINGGDGADTILDGLGSDTINGGDGDDFIQADKGQNRFIGGDGVDTISYKVASGGVEINLETNALGGAWAASDSISGFESAFGSNKGHDVIVGTSGANEIRTFRGRDQVTDGDGDDVVLLGGGNDIMYAGRGTDEYHAGGGTDVIVFSNEIDVDFVLGTATNAFGEVDTISGFEKANGSSFDDVMAGDSKGNTLRGRDGDDTLKGFGGTDVLLGGDDDDLLEGGGSNDTLSGGTGADTLVGGRGDDLLTGGDDTDVFIYRTDTGHDTITDFITGKDLLLIEASNTEDFGEIAEQTDVGVLFQFEEGGLLTVLNVEIGELESSIVFQS